MNAWGQYVDPITIWDELLPQSDSGTAVERFSSLHSSGSVPSQSKYYKDLIPLNRPQSGEQYAFQVDLDACTGCKGCVTACHSLNGLDDDEIWREVGLLQGGTRSTPILQTVTTACHHCDDPACLNGCPVLAYEKDPETGIVKHLDDQCIGCQYCVLKCSYDVPKYNKKRGIVRKCDMCSSRLASDEAPACVQACPNQAISITIVTKTEIAAQSVSGSSLLPDAPDSEYTKPSTRYIRNNPLPATMLAVGRDTPLPEDGHLPLVAMLLLTQTAIGLWLSSLGASIFTGTHSISSSLAGLSVYFIGLAFSVLHLGKPMGAWRFFLGLKKSWLSREILVFNALAGLMLLYPVAIYLSVDESSMRAIHYGVVALGGIGVMTSAMIYHDTRRPLWLGIKTFFRFYATVLVATLASSWFLFPDSELVRGLLIATITTKLLFEVAQLRLPKPEIRDSLWRSVLIMTGPLQTYLWIRFLSGMIGGILLPIVVNGKNGIAMAVLFIFIGELLERWMFFAGCASPRMPVNPKETL